MNCVCRSVYASPQADCLWLQQLVRILSQQTALHKAFFTRFLLLVQNKVFLSCNNKSDRNTEKRCLGWLGVCECVHAYLCAGGLCACTYLCICMCLSPPVFVSACSVSLLLPQLNSTLSVPFFLYAT